MFHAAGTSKPTALTRELGGGEEHNCGFPVLLKIGDWTMKTLVLTLAVLLTATTALFAQSLPNFGPNAPSYGDSYGKPVSGTYPPVGYGGYAYQPYRHHLHHRYHHRYRHHRYQW
jgi:hypothetical protein